MKNEQNTCFKLTESFLKWRWFTNSKVLSVFIWLIASANLKDEYEKYFDEVIKRGSVATNNVAIAYGCGLTVANVRAALACLEESGDITREKRNHYQIITVKDFDSYYDID